MMYGQNNAYYYPNYPYGMQNGAMPDMLNQAKMSYQPTAQNISQGFALKPANDMIWVLNENEATSYPVAPNNSVVLWDKNNPTIYVKSVNAQGVPSIRILDFNERTDAVAEKPEAKHECKCGSKFVTKEEFESLKTKLYALQETCDKLLVEQKPEDEEKHKATSKKSKGVDE